MNFTELYNKIKALDEAGPGMMDPNAMMQQQMANIMKNPSFQKLDPTTMMQQMKQQSKQARPATAPGQDSYTVNGKSVSKAEYDAFMSQHPELAANMQNPMNVVKGMKTPAMPNMPKLPVAPTQPASDDWEESMQSENQPDPAAARAARSSMANALANAPEPTLSKEDMYDECGGDMMGSMPPAPKQQDNVTMNVSMNGSGSGGIKDLMAILKNIESGKPAGAPNIPHDRDALFGDSYENSVEGSADTVTLDVADITPTGDDMHSKGNEAPKVNGGGNPMQEALKSRLAQMYDEIKEASHQEKTTMKHIKNPTAGEKKAAKDIKPGVKGYKDRIDMLKSAENSGRLKD